MLLLVSPTALAEIEHRGFKIDDSLLDSEQKSRFAGPVAASLIEQLAIVEAARLPPEVFDFFKKTKIYVDPGVRGNAGIFAIRGGEGAVRLPLIVFSANKPVLLHELLHAYHFYVLTLKNPDIANAFERAGVDGRYPNAFHRAHFLQNEKEYFAVTASIYLFGRIQQPPFNCTVLAKSDPAYLAFLEKTFGRHECN
ncbi:hypothetical protein C7C56_006165 [Massilia glaciei]|uniref:Uncharacterized protein n=2 Tax=Massilia glaciei TaxID=1524097 RepID=A0A2U2I4A6_9BURK|nr:hypothetical protein C7C56_006165 [Massilia glaciei]